MARQRFRARPVRLFIKCTVAVINNRFEITKGMALRSPD
jgi:hypothetical protein